MTQKELKEMYMNIIKTEVWEDEHMQNFAKKKCAYVVQFSNGDITDIEKPCMITVFLIDIHCKWHPILSHCHGKVRADYAMETF